MRHLYNMDFRGLFAGLAPGGNGATAPGGNGAKADDERAWLRDSLFPIGVFSFWWLIYFG
ncbi:MAG: hypothetical protein HQL44_02810 [Alphaproteobacteria bacterium]|nr:hypothetical protein [Alphaproteobacteria bacterium]